MSLRNFFISAILCRARNIKLEQRLRLQIDWRQKRAAFLSLIYFFGSFCVYDIPHNYVIPQAMPHATPQTHAAFTLTVFFFFFFFRV